MKLKIGIAFLIIVFHFGLYSQSPTIWQSLESKKNKVLVAAHRADWKNYPENSLPAIQSCIDQGIDIVEVDVQRTRDGHYVLMHDLTVRRTTNGKGRVSKYLLKDITKLRLYDHKKKLTVYTVPNLDTVLKLIKGKIIINLDKSSGRFEELLKIIKKYECGQYVILKGGGSAGYFRKWRDSDSSGTLFMPVVNGRKKDIDTFVSESSVNLMEILLRTDSDYICKNEVLQSLREKKCYTWYNALFNTISGGHTEGKNALNAWEWFLDHNVKIIQTDYPFELTQFLIDKELHEVPTGFTARNLDNLPGRKTNSISGTETNYPSEKNHENDVYESQIENTHKKLPDKKTISVSENKNNKYYTIKSGDTLSKIASNYGITVSRIKKLNPILKKKKILKPGSRIRIE